MRRKRRLTVAQARALIALLHCYARKEGSLWALRTQATNKKLPIRLDPRTARWLVKNGYAYVAEFVDGKKVLNLKPDIITLLHDARDRYVNVTQAAPWEVFVWRNGQQARPTMQAVYKLEQILYDVGFFGDEEDVGEV